MTPLRMRWLTASVAAVSLLGLTACSSGTSDTTSSAAGTVSSAAPIAGILSLEELYAGTYSQPPSTSPPGAAGKSVWWISCGQAMPSCAEPAAAAADAAKVLGIDFHVADSNSNIGGQEATAVRTAISAGADAILVYGGGGCDGAQGALQEAKDAGILLMGVETPDCSASGGPEIFNVVANYSENYPDTEALWRGFGEFSADYAINKTNGQGKIIVQTGNTIKLETWGNEGFNDRIKEKCPGCEIVAEVPYVDSELTPDGPWIQGLRSALVQHPDATAVYMPWDFMMVGLGGAQAVEEAGLDAIVFGGQADTSGLDLLRQGGITAISTARSPEWSAYAAMDTINRALQGETDFPPSGIGFQLVDQTRNLPASGPFVPPIDFKAAYLKAWNNGSGTVS